MAPSWQAYPSAVTTGVNSIPDTVVDPPESIGTPGDAVATSVNSTNSAFAMLKGICSGLGVPAGSGGAVVNTYPKIFGDPLVTLGEMDDPPATDTGRWSAISLMKGILVGLGI